MVVDLRGVALEPLEQRQFGPVRQALCVWAGFTGTMRVLLRCAPLGVGTSPLTGARFILPIRSMLRRLSYAGGENFYRRPA